MPRRRHGTPGFGVQLPSGLRPHGIRSLSPQTPALRPAVFLRVLAHSCAFCPVLARSSLFLRILARSCAFLRVGLATSPCQENAYQFRLARNARLLICQYAIVTKAAFCGIGLPDGHRRRVAYQVSWSVGQLVNWSVGQSVSWFPLSGRLRPASGGSPASDLRGSTSGLRTAASALHRSTFPVPPRPRVRRWGFDCGCSVFTPPFTPADRLSARSRGRSRHGNPEDVEPTPLGQGDWGNESFSHLSSGPPGRRAPAAGAKRDAGKSAGSVCCCRGRGRPSTSGPAVAFAAGGR